MIGGVIQDLIYYNSLRAKLRYGFKACRRKREELIHALDSLNFADLYHATKEIERTPNRRRIPFVPEPDLEKGKRLF